MMQENDHKSLRIADLIVRFLKGELSTEEAKELAAWLDADPANRALFAELNDPALQKKDFGELSGKELNADWQKISLRIGSPKRNKTSRYKWQAIAAAILLIFSITGWWFIGKKEALSKKEALVKNDVGEVYPGSYTAVLTDGKGVSHHLFQNNTDTIGNYAINTPAGLAYRQGNNATDSNTLTVPVKGMFHVLLEDGTEVWLHPSSTLRYPVRFAGTQRRIYLTGEAYFKVAKNTAMPFRVYCRGVITEAIGTEFNVNGYSNIVTTSLVEGVVRITTKKGSTTMTAGNSIRVTAETIPRITEKLDTAVAEGWKNGDFIFRKAKLETVMTTLSEWYGVKTSFSPGYDWTNKTFTGKLPRNVPLGDVLEILTMTGIAQFNMRNDIVYIDPGQAFPH